MEFRDKVALKLFKYFLKNRYGKTDSQDFWEVVYNDTLKAMNVGSGDGYEKSGEKNAIEILFYNNRKKYPIVFDVGANIGGYALEVQKILPNAKIHCFEPAKETYKALCENVKGENVTLNNFGLSDTNVDAMLYYDSEKSGMASLYNRQLDYFEVEFTKSENVKLKTLDEYCEENNIDYIDFLKMDIEGNELNALNGAPKMLKNGINAIQIEFGGCNIDSRTYFRDFWNLLHDDYNVYRIVRDGLYELKKYNEKMEMFTCTNYMFIRK